MHHWYHAATNPTHCLPLPRRASQAMAYRVSELANMNQRGSKPESRHNQLPVGSTDQQELLHL